MISDENETKFMEFVRRLHGDKNCLQHRCTLLNQMPTGKTKPLNSFLNKFQMMYVYLILLPYNHHDTKFYYESNDSVDHARQQHMKNYPYILHPFSRFRVVFDEVFVIPYLSLQMYNASIPGFGLTVPRIYFLIISCVLLVVGVMYIIINFSTGYCVKRNKKVILSPKSIIKHYLLTYFIVDLAMCIPSTMYIFILNSNSRGARQSSILCFVSFIRVNTCWKLIENLLTSWIKNRHVIARMMLAVKTVYMLHICTCIIGFLMYSDGLKFLLVIPMDNCDQNFVSYISELIGAMSKLYYSAAVVKPANIVGACILLLSILFGSFVYSYIMAMILMEALAETVQETQYNELSSEVKHFARQEHRDPVIREKIVQMFHVIFLGPLLKERRVKQTIPDNLRRDLNAETIGALVKKSEVLAKLDDYLFLRVLDLLNLVVLLPNDHLVTEGQMGDCMYFLFTGRLIRYKDSVEQGHLDDGDNFGEDAVTSDFYIHRETVIAGTACFVYKLSRRDYRL